MKIVNRHTHTHAHTERKDEHYVPPWHTLYARGITKLWVGYEQVSLKSMHKL